MLIGNKENVIEIGSRTIDMQVRALSQGHMLFKGKGRELGNFEKR